MPAWRLLLMVILSAIPPGRSAAQVVAPPPPQVADHARLHLNPAAPLRTAAFFVTCTNSTNGACLRNTGGISALAMGMLALSAKL